jgi:hypothetical protein
VNADMQSEYGYGFLLKAPTEYPEEEYQELKTSIEQLCENALAACKSCGADNLNFAILSKNSIFVTVAVRESRAEFALYDRAGDRIIQECSIGDFKRYVSPRVLDDLTIRIEKECKAIVQGRILNRKNLDDAWNERFMSKQNIEKAQDERPQYGLETKLVFKPIDDDRSMSNGMRNLSRVPLTEEEIDMVKHEIKAIQADESKFIFNDPDHIAHSTCYNPKNDVIYVTKNVLPDNRFGTIHPRDLMSVRAVLAHEYYGHRPHREEYLFDYEHGTTTTLEYEDECRASIEAAKITPNLSQKDRRDLIMDAVYRADEAGQYIQNDAFMKEVLYGYKDGERNITTEIGPIVFIDKQSQDRIDAERYNSGSLSLMPQEPETCVKHARKTHR